MNNIYLIGMMGTGKSTVGKILSEKMNKNFVDLDLEIEKSTGKTITELFENDGEEKFRDEESRQLKYFNESIIACGGGIILKNKNCEFISNNGTAVLLTASISELSKRLSKSKKRPLLAKDTIEETLTKIWLERQLNYLSTADLTIETDGENPEQITNNILTNLTL